jgi:hypothetical protein
MDVRAPVEVSGGYLARSFSQHGASIDRGDMVTRLEDNPEAADLVGASQTKQTIAVIIGAIGGGLVGWPIGAALAGNDDPPWVLAAIGGGLIVVSIPIDVWGDADLVEAVEVHNRQVSTAVAGTDENGP